MNTIAPETVTLKLSRFIKAPRERVFEAWTTADELARWLGPGARKVISASIDLRPGGEYRLNSIGADCSIDMVGQYREVKRPERLVFTWTVGNCLPEVAGTQTLVTVELTEQEGGTLLQLTHEGLPGTEIRDRHSEGWEGSFDNLEKLV